MEDALIVPGAEPFFFGVPPGDRVGCLLLHGFTAMPEEMRWLGESLAESRAHGAWRASGRPRDHCLPTWPARAGPTG